MARLWALAFREAAENLLYGRVDACTLDQRATVLEHSGARMPLPSQH
jgi:hypothetical protein